MTRFSSRMGLAPQAVEIAVRHDAPEELRAIVVDIAYESGWTPTQLRTKVCGALRKRADKNNWTDFPNVDHEVRTLVQSCEWFQVYDVIEAIFGGLKSGFARTQEGKPVADRFADEVNNYFRQVGIGWQLVDGAIEVRGSEAFEVSTSGSVSELKASNHATAANEIHQALLDLSRRPEPDITGAVQHALAALECVARTVTGDERATLGAILGRNPALVPSPLNIALEKLWGFASEQGRHLREGRVPSLEDAELAVQVAAAVAKYLSRRYVPDTGV